MSRHRRNLRFRLTRRQRKKLAYKASVFRKHLLFLMTEGCGGRHLSAEEREIWVRHWPASVEWVGGRQPVHSCAEKDDWLLEL